MTDKKPLISYGWLRALLYVMISLVVMSLIFFVAGTMTTSSDDVAVTENAEQSLKNFLLSYVIIAAIFIGFALLMRKFIDREPIVSLGLQWKGFAHTAASGTFVAIIILSLGSIILVLFKFLFFTGIEVNTTNLLYSALLFILVAFTEEIAFRGYILNNLMQSTNKWIALSISAVAFAAFHYSNPGGNNFLPMLNILVAGFLLGINYIYTKNLWFAIFLHFTWNFFQGPILGYEVSGLDASGLFLQTLKGPALVTGGDFGFEGSLVCLILNVIACILLWQYYERQPTQLTPVNN